MHILLVNTTARTGGASIACARLKAALEARGHEVRLMVRDDGRVVNRLRFVAERLALLLHNGLKRSNVFALDDGRCGTDITRTADYAWADAVHLHWVNQAMLGIGDIRRLAEACRRDGKPLVWTLHDIWPATGLCHVPAACTRWQQGCGHCPMLAPRGANDLSARTFRRKALAYGHGVIDFVTCSHQLADQVRRSPLMAGQRLHVIANPLDTDFFCPGDKAEARRTLSLPAEGPLVLFVAYNVNDENKGFDRVVAAASALASAPASASASALTSLPLTLIAVGKNATAWKDRADVPVWPIEYVSDRETMRTLYRACDVLVVASQTENLPNTIAEAMACGTPVAATAVGGIPEMVTPGVNGALATPPPADPTATGAAETTAACVASLADALRALLCYPDPAVLSTAARAAAVEAYAADAVAQRYETLCTHGTSPQNHR